MALIPPLLLALFACWSGTFAGSAAWPAGPAGQFALVLVALLGVGAGSDPLRLGRSGRWLLAAFLVAFGGSLWASPVPRAGRSALLLLPALLLPAAVARCWQTRKRRERGLVAWSLVVSGVALWALVTEVRQGLPRAAEPLGHHNLLAAWLVVTLPPVALLLRHRGWRRGLGLFAGVVGIAALVATRSFAGWLALAAVALGAAMVGGPARRLVLGLALVGLAMLVPRASAILSGSDTSTEARRTYWTGAFQGALERPLIGWGPGSTPWQLARFLQPRPGVNPPGEVVGEAHSLYLASLFELGFPATSLALAVLALFGWCRLRDRAAAEDRGALAAGLLALGGAAVAGGGAAFLATTAIPVAVAGAAGIALAGAGGPAPVRTQRRTLPWAPGLLVVGCGVALMPGALAERSYEAAARAGSRAVAVPHLEKARAWDPDFPLYGARWAWASSAPALDRATEAMAAARKAGGVAALWYRAAATAREAGRGEWVVEALRQAMALDPLGGFAPFQLFEATGAVDCAARSLAAEPRLAAATLWRELPDLRRAALERLAGWPGLDAGFRAELVRRASGAAPSGGDAVDLAAQMDQRGAVAVSLHQFRRTPWPADVARIRVERSAVRALRGLPSAAVLASSATNAFPRDRCAP